VRLERDTTRARVVLYALATAAMLYSHVYGLFVLAAQVVYLLVRRARPAPGTSYPLRPFAIALAGAALLFVPWAVALARQASEELSGDGANLGWLREPGLTALRDTATQWAGWVAGGAGTWMVPLLGLSAVAGSLAVVRWTARPVDDHPRAGLLLGLWVVIPVAAPFALSHATVNLYHPRYTISSAVGAAILAAVACARLPSRAGIGVLAVGTAALIAATVTHHPDARNEDWRWPVGISRPTPVPAIS
jgi:hypothetical protein